MTLTAILPEYMKIEPQGRFLLCFKESKDNVLVNMLLTFLEDLKMIHLQLITFILNLQINGRLTLEIGRHHPPL